MRYAIGVDCGSGSVRSGLFEVDTGKLLRTSVQEIKVNNPEPGYYEQSSDDIWGAVVKTVRDVSKGGADNVKAIAFCATCSLVAIDSEDNPVSVSKGGDPGWNIVMWMDHRADKEAELINATQHPVLKYVGGSISLEMETPKLLWLKKRLPESYAKTVNYFDLGDFLRWKTTSRLERSMCCIVCKWTHVNEPGSNYWDESYFAKIGLSDVLPKIGTSFSFPGDSSVISAAAAKELGLTPSVKVGFSQIDAHSGVLGMIGCGGGQGGGEGRLALISGTSVCHMALSAKEVEVPGVWGPYYGVILKDMYLAEGGQSAAGKLLDHVVEGHAAYRELALECGNKLGKVLSYLEDMITQEEDPLCLTADLHMWPDFHGNRSPLADPTLKGMISGLTLSSSRRDLAALYFATIQALCYGSRHIKEEMEASGHSFSELVICGGLTKSKLYLQTHADVIGLPVVVPECAEPVLLGAAISAASALGSDLRDNVKGMAGGASVIQPNPQTKRFHDKKYRVFLRMVADQKAYRDIMKS